MNTRPLLTVATLANLLLPGGVLGQGGVVEGVEVWAGAGGWASDPGDDLPAGLRVGLAVLGPSSRGRGVSLEAVYGRYRREESRSVVSEYGVNLALHMAPAAPRGLHPFLRGRVGWHRRSGSASRADARQDALSLSPEAGAAFPLSERVELVAAAELAWLWYAEARGREGGAIGGTSGHGLRWGMRLGIGVRTDITGGADTRRSR